MERDIRSLRILEIGDEGTFHRQVPDQLTWIWTNPAKVKERGGSFDLRMTPWLAWKLRGQIARGEYDLIILMAMKDHLWRKDRFFLRNIWALLMRVIRRFYKFAHYLVFFAPKGKTRIVMIDTGDTMIIGPQNHVFFSKVDFFFKRELPQNHWNCFLQTSRFNEDLVNVQRNPYQREALKKLRPFPLGIHKSNMLIFSDMKAENKTSDIFYVGAPRSTVREAGIPLIERLRDEGIRVDMPAKRLEKEEFLQRMSASWLAWSPEGMGWDCFRHHESLIVGAVPIINHPTIHRYRPLIEGEHAFYYSVEGDDLVRVIKKALADKEQLLRMVAAGREHIARWGTTDALLRYLMEPDNQS